MSTLGEIMAGIPDPPPQNETTWTASSNGEREFIKWAGRVATDAAEGNRNNTVFKIAAEACGRGLQKNLALSLCRKHGNGLSDAEVSRTVESAYSRERGANPPTRTRLESGGDVEQARATPPLRRPSEIRAYDLTNDADCLLGRRWVNRGGSCCWFGQTGLGKSSLTTQAMIQWALGHQFFGITPKRDLTSVCFQAENDTGDVKEQLDGVIQGLGLENHAAQLDDRVRIISECSCSGDGFISMLRSVVRDQRPDLVWIDPLLAYFGDDISNQKACSRFFRNQLNPIGQEFGCAFMIVHHTGKPKDPFARKGYTLDDLSYLGLGSSELSNWTRAVLSLRENEGAFELLASKRGKRAGLLDGDANPTRAIHIQHAEDGIYWQRANAPATEANYVQSVTDDVLGTLKPGEFYKISGLVDALERATGKRKSSIYKKGSAENAVLENIKRAMSIPEQPFMFRLQIPKPSK